MVEKKSSKKTGEKKVNEKKAAAEASAKVGEKKVGKKKVSKKATEAKVETKTKETRKAEDKKSEKKVSEKKVDEKKSEKPSNKKAKKSKGKIWAIVCGIIGGVAVLGLAAWGIVTLILENQPLEQDWAQTYYVYLNEHPLEAELKDADDKTITNAKEYEVGFYDVEEVDEPVMAVSYVTDSETYLTYYWLDAEKNVQRTVMSDPSEIELLHNIKNDTTDYYIYYKSGDTNYYESLGKAIKNLQTAENTEHVDNTPEYKFTEKDVTTVTDKDGNNYTVTKFEQTFVPVDDNIKATVLPVDYDNKQLKETLKDESYEYKVLKEIADKNADMIRQVVEDIQKKVNKIAEVEKENEEIAAKKKAEEEARKAAEEAKKGLKLEGKTLAWGRYKLDEEWFGENDEYIVINQDGTCTFGKKSCTWYKSTKDFTQSPESKNVHEAICFRADYNYCYYAYRNNMFGDGDIKSYRYVGQ